MAFTLPKWGEIPEIELYMDQVVGFIEAKLQPLLPPGAEEKPITASMINNYVKQKVLAPPVKKKYDRGHVARLLLIFLMKRVLSISEIRALLDYMARREDMSVAYDRFADELERQQRMGREGALAGEAEADSVLQAAVAALLSKLHIQRLLAAAEAPEAT